MNSDITAGKWKQMVGKAKQHWGDLTDDDLKVAEGGAEQLQGILQEKYGRTKEQAQEQLDEFVKKYH